MCLFRITSNSPVKRCLSENQPIRNMKLRRSSSRRMEIPASPSVFVTSGYATSVSKAKDSNQNALHNSRSCTNNKERAELFLKLESLAGLRRQEFIDIKPVYKCIKPFITCSSGITKTKTVSTVLIKMKFNRATSFEP